MAIVAALSHPDASMANLYFESLLAIRRIQIAIWLTQVDEAHLYFCLTQSALAYISTCFGHNAQARDP